MIRVSFFFALLGLPFFCAGAYAESASAPAEPSQVFRQFRANQSLLAKLQKEKADISVQFETNPLPSLERKLNGLEYKIKALEEDAQSLKRQITPEEETHAMLSVLAEQKIAQTATKPAKPDEAPSGPASRKTSIPATIPSPEHSLHERALELVAERRLFEAIKIYQEIVIQNPDDGEAYMIMGHCYLLTGSYAKAEECFNNAVHIDPSNIDEIVPFYQNMTLQNPDDDTAFSNLGYALIIIGDFLKARQAFEEALRINPGNVQAAQGIGLLNANR